MSMDHGESIAEQQRELPEIDEAHLTSYSRRTLLNRAITRGAVLILGLPAITGAVGASPGVERFNFNLTGMEFDTDCLDETLEATQGSFVVLVHEHFDGAGGLHFVLQQTIQNAQLVGLDSGTIYRAVGGSMVSTQAHPPYPVTITSVLRERWVSQGPEPDIAFDASVKLRINGNGDVVLNSLEPEECSTIG